MRVFLTGATGFIGSRVVPELLAAGHRVIGMTRSDAGAQSLSAAGAEAHHATLEDLESIRAGAAKADAVIHTAFDHDFSQFVANCDKDRRVIETLGSVLKGSSRPLIITSGTGMGALNHSGMAKEDVFNANNPNPRAASEIAGNVLLDAGVNVSVVRLPQVHDPVRQGLVSPYIDIARAKGKVAFVGEGRNRWPAAHVLDVAKLYQLALDKGKAGARYHAVAEEGIAARDIAEVVGAGLQLPVVSLSPEEAKEHFGWLAMFIGMDLPASSAWTREVLGWHPTGPGLIADLKQMDYAVETSH
ncbi:NAD-dependent dehydratase [Luteibacter rhizovicinus DSM 16549]|uniref:NAD-dependent dehydratase n=1 Tax=Luteibacter rhizovicinus DSM 16549 TaxID=1440763 RepID=A0A0G9HCJ9_9GAMM|nr:SDR family oxidoreductase [Luteibacter rhizovicinus]APG05856.1 NAD-dependent dehydratase [Luteibacter rhizovicinus DSM 16549]KLD67196.1 NAD-dependent dehydratase [Luteibacter rhizovicinus DSM 16549]KLD76463.1 NAD-dependent dehydratase [Xanthomonas hyacinthi DSM 19077]